MNKDINVNEAQIKRLSLLYNKSALIYINDEEFMEYENSSRNMFNIDKARMQGEAKLNRYKDRDKNMNSDSENTTDRNVRNDRNDRNDIKYDDRCYTCILF